MPNAGRPVVRRHSFHNIRDFTNDSPDRDPLHKRRLEQRRKPVVRERNRLWNHAVMSVIVVASQILIGSLLILAVSMIWASIFMEFPPADHSRYETLPKRIDALAAWSEMGQSIFLSLGYRLLSSIEIKEALNNKFSSWAFNVKRLELMPRGSYNPDRIVPMVFTVDQYDEATDWFHAHLAGAMPSISIEGRPFISYNNGIYANATVILKLRDAFGSRLAFKEMISLRRLDSSPSESVDLISFPVALGVSWASVEIPLLPQLMPVEHTFLRQERLLSILEDWRWELSGRLSRLKDKPPVKAYVDPGAPILPHFRRPIAVPEQILLLSPEQRELSLSLWTLFLQRVLYTFVLGPEMQRRFYALMDRIVKNSGGPIGIRILEMNLGMPDWRSCPSFIMLEQLSQPYTYRMLMDIDWPLMKIKLAINGAGNSSSLVFSVTHFRAKGIVILGIEHPLARDLSKGVDQHFISFSFERMPDIEFGASLDAESSHIFGMSLANISPWLQDLFNVYLLKPFVTRFAKMFLMGCAVSPMIAYIPWLDDPGDLKFNSNHAQSIFRWIRRLFAAMHYSANAMI